MSNTNPNVKKWTDTYSCIIPSFFSIDKISIDINNIDPCVKNELIKKFKKRPDLNISFDHQLNHFIESYLLTTHILKKYNPYHSLYYGKKDE